MSETVFEGKQGRAPCRLFLLQQSLFLGSNFMEITRLI